MPKLIKQRTRWTTGFLRNVLTDYRDLVGNPRYGVLGLMVLPLGFVAVLGGVGLFVLALFELIGRLVKTYMVTEGVPLSFILMPRFSLEWFYAPITFIAVISLVVTVMSIGFIIIGRKVSNTPASLTLSIIGYTFLYVFIAPFWLVRAMIDVATGTRRAWR